MTEQPTAPANATEASSRLSVLAADKIWADKLLSGDPAANKEFGELNSMIAAGADPVDQAIAGTVLGDIPDGDQKRMAEAATWMRGLGLSDDVIRQQLSGHEVTAQEF